MRTLYVHVHPVRALLLFAACGFLGACATPPKRPDVVWPPAPELARVKWVRTFSSAENINRGTFSAIGRAFLPNVGGNDVAQPTGLALSPDEKTLYVACNSARKVLAVDLEKGNFRRAAAAEGNRPAAPFGVATDADGNLYVTDHVSGVVLVYDPKGSFLRRFGEGKLERASGIAIDRRRQVVYVTAGASSESQHHRIEVFSLKGQHLRTIGTRGHDPGNFNFPANLAVSRDGQLYVVDMLNFRVQVFDPDGQLVGMFGRIGSGAPGVFDKAKSVALDSFGNEYVVDSQAGYVQLFNPKHQPLMVFGGRGTNPGYFSLPTAIAITSKNTIFVADFGTSAILEYQLVNTVAQDSYLPLDKSVAPLPTSTTPAPNPPGQKPQGG